MMKKGLLPVWAGIILLSGMFLMGQESWFPDAPVIAGIDPPGAETGQEVTISGFFFGPSPKTSAVSIRPAPAPRIAQTTL